MVAQPYAFGYGKVREVVFKNRVMVHKHEDYGNRQKMSITGIEVVNDGIKRVIVTPNNEFHCKPGQHVCFVSGDKVSHKHHISNIPHKDHFIEIQFDTIAEQDGYKAWIEDAFNAGGEVDVEGPHGNFYYTTRYGLDYPLILIGKGIGLAPLTAITKYALAAGHYGHIYLFHYCLTEFDLYYIQDLEKITQQYNNFTYIPCVQEEGLDARLTPEPIDQIIKKTVPNVTDSRVFICGDQNFNELMFKKVLKCGGKRNLIAVDTI